MTSTAAQALWLVGLAFLIYLVYQAVYRLYLSPLARIPGPRSAALTGGYEMYYDLIQEARFPWKIKELHKKYGIDRGERFAEIAADLE